MPEDTTALLLKMLEREFAALPSYQSLGDIDCCKACGPSEANPLVTTKQPPEVWEPFLRHLAGRALMELRSDLEMSSRTCESPIEELMLLALVLQANLSTDTEVEFFGGEPEPFSSLSAISIMPQAVVGKYRVDFQVSAYVNEIERHANPDLEPDVMRWHKASILVECDGHDFHEKTKEQASRDKQRDRDLQTAGFKVFRYTGSDIWRGGLKSANEVIQAALRLAKESPAIAVKPLLKRQRE